MKHSPREFMKMRRPERFSDTVVVRKGELNRSILEYKLEVLTSNSQEQEFQNFCFKLAQLEVAPNIRPQTGPSGGGDSKADSETYPVSDFTRLNFWEGIANESGERWAFAISAKKEWVGKVTKDVKGIVDTSRDYKRIFFITNQFTKDKKRAEIEDKLSKEHSTSVTILDRTWILDRVFQNHRQKLVIQELHIGEGLEDQVSLGPNDAERMKLFEQLNSEIETALSNAIITFKVVDKSLDTARLARGMGRSRMDVDGLFDRAIRLAEQMGSAEQVYSVKYEKAWTIFFWFEDFEKFIQLYDELELIAETSANIYTLQRQHNLSGLLRASRAHSFFSKEYIEKKLTNLKKWLSEFATDDTKPSASHQARMLLALGDLFDNATQKKDLNQNFKEIGIILQGTERLIGFPYEESVVLIQENGDVFGDIPEFEKLINLIAEIDARRKGEIPAAKSFLKYGMQHLDVVNSGITMGTLLSAYEDFPAFFDGLQVNIPESSNSVPDVLDEVIYNLRWMLTMQDPADGGVYHKCTNAAFDGMVMPGVTKSPRYVVQKSTAATLDFAAVMAQAARVLKFFSKQLPGLADSCLSAARTAWEWSVKYPGVEYSQREINSRFQPPITTGEYGNGQLKDERFWAAAELFATTRNKSYYDTLLNRSKDFAGLPSWSNVEMLGYYTLLRHKRILPSYTTTLVSAMKDSVISRANIYIASAKTNAFGTAMGDSKNDFVWGSSAVAANQGILLLNAWLLTKDQKYLRCAFSNADYLLGRNATGYSFVTGFGAKSPLHPHHRQSVADGITEPVPGLLVGGPNPGQQDSCSYLFTEPETAYTDEDCSYASNEIAINWNAPAVYLFNALEAVTGKKKVWDNYKK